MERNWSEERKKIIGLGENSYKKNYYPELQDKLDELESSQINLENILNSTSDCILIHDVQGKIFYLNQPAQKLLNVDDTYELSVADITSCRNDVTRLPRYWNIVAHRKSLTIEWIICQLITRKEITVQVSINNIIWNGQRCFVAVMRDFTERKDYEDKLLKAKMQAEESDQLKTAFLQNMSHEIRTPMNAIVGFSELLNDADLNDESRKDYTSIIVSSSNQLLSVVNNILAIATLEAKQEKTIISDVNLNEVMDLLYTIFHEQVISKNIALECEKPLPDMNSYIYTDRTKLIQILTNLLNNALKFTSQGYIKFGYKLKDSDLEFYVSDSGIGIQGDMHTKIFDRFRQADKSIQVNYGGTGLGLAISRELVHLLNGTIWVESEPEYGANFYFTIPYHPVLKSLNKEAFVSCFPNNYPTILIAEDEEYNFRYLEALLKKSNTNLIHTQNGLETLEICRANPGINLVLMDIKMPIMDGFTSAKLIKEFRPHLPIIAQTAYAMDYEVRKFKGTVFDDYVTKPLNKETLSQKIVKYLDLSIV